MRKLITLAVAAGFLLAGATAQAGTLTSATWNGAFQGTPFTLTTAGGSLVASGTSSATGANVAVTVASNASFSIVNPGPPQLTITQTLAGNQTLAISGGAVAANQGIAGNTNVFLFVGIPLLFLAIPLNIGVSGMSTVNTSNPLVGAVDVVVTFGAWTTGAVTITGLFGTTTTASGATNMTVALPNFTTAGSVALSAGGGGTITLVSPTTVAVCAGGTPTCDGSTQSNRTAGATVLTLTFVPEPGTLLLLGAGLAGLAALGRGRRS